MCLSGAANGAGTAANGTMGTAPTPGIAAAVTAAANALSGGGAAAFSSILRLLNLLPATVRDGAAGERSTAVGRPRRLPCGVGRPGPGQLVGWGRARGRGASSKGRGEPRCRSARAFRASFN